MVEVALLLVQPQAEPEQGEHTGDEASTIEDFYEPYLMQLGLIERTPRGRLVTLKAKQHLANLK